MIVLPPQVLHFNQRLATLAVPCDLRRGWHRLRLNLSSRQVPAVYKRGTLTLSDDAGDIAREAFAWNETLREDLILRLTRPATRITLSLQHTQGEVEIERFTLRRVSSTRAVARATALKVNLLSQFNCLGPVLARGRRLLLRGEFRTFARKLMNGLPDSRVMKLETKRAEEAGAAWWRRRSLSPEKRREIERECEAIETPVPVAVILPVDETRIDHARQAAFSVLRQIYPHWQLRILWLGDEVPRKLASAVAHEPRAKFVREFSSPCERMLVLSPDAELADDALLRISQSTEDARFQNHAVMFSKVMTRECREHFTTATSVLRWAQTFTEIVSTEPLVHSLDSGADSILEFSTPPLTQRLHLAANFTGISGWDAVAFQILRGLARSGVEVKRHPQALVKTHTLPPGLSFEESPRTPQDAQLIIAAPFQVKPFSPDRRSAVFTMWECDRLPSASVSILNQARVVIVPSRWGAECFRASGVTVPLEVLPLGYDPLVFHPRTANSETVFGTAGALGAGGVRKNLHAVIEAFRTAFPHESNVRLRIKITPNCPPLDYAADPRIDLTRAVLPANDVAAWNRSLTAYVNASLAEGFGLHLLEAMACGVPLISTKVSGPAEYFDESTGIVLPHREVPVKNDYYDGHWYEPDFDAMVEAMQRLHHDRQLATTLGRAASSRAHCFSWRDTGRRLNEVLKRHRILA